MNEAGVWQTLKQGIGMWALTTRIETSTGNGVPDVVVHLPGKHAFIEIKYIPEWPKRPTTKVCCPLRPEQRLWLFTRGKFSGNCWVFIRIANDFFLMPWDVAIHMHDKGFTKEEWYKYPFCWHNSVNWEEFRKILKGGDRETE